MTTRAPNWWEQKYVKGAILALQSKGWLLKPYCNSAGTIDGKTVTWRLAGSGEATVRSDIVEERPAMNADRQIVNATIVPYEANDWINTTDVTLMSENEQQVVQETCAMAMGRKFDKALLATLDAAGGAINTIGNGTAAIAITDFFTAIDNIMAIGSGGYELVAAIPRKLFRQLLLYREISNSDWVGDEFPLQKEMMARRYENCTIIPIPDAMFTPPSASVVNGYVWLKEAVGLVWNNELKTRVDYVPTKKAWFAANDMACASTVLLPLGIQRLQFATNVAYTRPTYG